MAVTNWHLADYQQSRFPHTHNSLQRLVMAMADYCKNRGKKTILGIDRGLKSYKRFERVLRDTLLAMIVDGIVRSSDEAEEVREILVELIEEFAKAFPNWQEAYSFANEYFKKDAAAAKRRIEDMMHQC